MNPYLQHLVMTYGYWLMAFGAIIEGETFLIAGGIAAQQGLLHLPGLILLAFIGSTLHDNSFFCLGRFWGGAFFKKRPQFYAKVEGILKYFDRYGVWIILGLRFAYGIRTFIPAAIGMSPISFKKFFFYDVIGGVIWSVTFVCGGYLFGGVLTTIMHKLNYYTSWGGNFFVLLIMLGILGYIIWRSYEKFFKRPSK